MSTVKIEIEIPEAMLQYLDYNDAEYNKKVKELMIYQLIKEDKISFGKAAEILEIDKLSLMIDLGKMGISYFDGDIDEIKEDALNIKKCLEAK